MNPLHGVTDPAKVSYLAESIALHGWVGPPLVCDGENLLTGVHRYAAWRRLNRPDGELPTVDVADLFAAQGRDWVYVLHTLPDAVIDAFGIDVR